MADAYNDKNVVAIVVNVKEEPSKAAQWKKQLNWSIPVLLDLEGSVAARYAPAGILPDLPRDQIPIASNLIVDPSGRIQFYSLLDSRNFDAQLIALRARLDQLLE